MARSIADLNRFLLRRGVDRLAQERDCCTVCHRTPLVGEHVARYANGSLTCALCTSSKRRDIERVELVHHSEWGHAVKPLGRVPRAA
ncbi:MAG: hypothetical protein ACJ762_04920 [Solirubrobacteraceae bacterium]